MRTCRDPISAFQDLPLEILYHTIKLGTNFYNHNAPEKVFYAVLSAFHPSTILKDGNLNIEVTYSYRNANDGFLSSQLLFREKLIDALSGTKQVDSYC